MEFNNRYKNYDNSSIGGGSGSGASSSNNFESNRMTYERKSNYGTGMSIKLIFNRKKTNTNINNIDLLITNK